jgi:hypothetical protein
VASRTHTAGAHRRRSASPGRARHASLLSAHRGGEAPAQRPRAARPRPPRWGGRHAMRALVQPAEAPDARGARLVAAMPSRAQACEGGQQGCWLERRAPREAIIPHHRGVWGARVGRVPRARCARRPAWCARACQGGPRPRPGAPQLVQQEPDPSAAARGVTGAARPHHATLADHGSRPRAVILHPTPLPAGAPGHAWHWPAAAWPRSHGLNPQRATGRAWPRGLPVVPQHWRGRGGPPCATAPCVRELAVLRGSPRRDHRRPARRPLGWRASASLRAGGGRDAGCATRGRGSAVPPDGRPPPAQRASRAGPRRLRGLDDRPPLVVHTPQARLPAQGSPPARAARGARAPAACGRAPARGAARQDPRALQGSSAPACLPGGPVGGSCGRGRLALRLPAPAGRPAGVSWLNNRCLA